MIDLGDALMQREIRAGEIIDEIVADRPPVAVGQADRGLAVQIEGTERARERDPHMRDLTQERGIAKNREGVVAHRRTGARIMHAPASSRAQVSEALTKRYRPRASSGRRQRPSRIQVAASEPISNKSPSRTYGSARHAGNPMTADEVNAKALDLMAPILGAARAKELIAVC